jgi:hypothetical protein
MFNVPLLLLCWKRPAELRQVLDAIRGLEPANIFVACDGPRPFHSRDANQVKATREIIEQEITWPCAIKRLYADQNQGCRLGVSRAITWFFQHVEEGIILEDDCVPHPDFFTYCSTLLDRYRHDMRVWCISGNNFQDADWLGDGDYFFGQIPMCWGWATWRTRWAYYDSDLSKWPIVRKYHLLPSLIADPVMRSYWARIWDILWSSGTPDSWAYRWAFTCVIERGLTALPKVNLVENIGFGVDATHTTLVRNSRPAFSLNPSFLEPPPFVASLKVNDIAIFDNHFGGRWHRFPYIFLAMTRQLLHKCRRLF